MKKIGLFLLGFILGGITVFCILQKNNFDTTNPTVTPSMIRGLTEFKHPGDEISSKRIEIFQVLANNVALANVYKTNDKYEYDPLLVLIIGDENTYFYDNQKIDMTSKKLVQTGVYTYETTSKIQKTVPAVIISAY